LSYGASGFARADERISPKFHANNSALPRGIVECRAPEARGEEQSFPWRRRCPEFIGIRRREIQFSDLGVRRAEKTAGPKASRPFSSLTRKRRSTLRAVHPTAREEREVRRGEGREGPGDGDGRGRRGRRAGRDDAGGGRTERRQVLLPGPCCYPVTVHRAEFATRVFGRDCVE